MLVTDADILLLTTLCSSLLLLSSLIGLTGTLLNSRPLLALYTLLLWPTLISLLSIGYASYKRSTFSLDRKLSAAWSEDYTDEGRMIIQESLGCCGFADPAHEAFYGAGGGGGCYPRSARTGCKGPLLRCARANLTAIWKAAFSALPLHLTNIVIALICANHVTRTFGAGIMPRAYRLRVADVRKDAKEILDVFTREGEKGEKTENGGRGGGVTREPPMMAQTGTGRGIYRDDKEFTEVDAEERSVGSFRSRTRRAWQ